MRFNARETPIGAVQGKVRDRGVGEVLGMKLLDASGPVSFAGEQKRDDLSASFSAAELMGATPKSAELVVSWRIYFDTDGGTFDGSDTYSTGKYPDGDPSAPEYPFLLTDDSGKLVRLPLLTRGATETFVGWTIDGTETKVAADTVYTDDTLLKARYVPHQHSFTYAADGSTVTATCANTDGKCNLTDGKVTLTLNAPEAPVYDGTAKEATISGYPDTAVDGLADADDYVVLATWGDAQGH